MAKDIFSSPIGPGPNVFDVNAQAGVDAGQSFVPDGGEAIYTLPNGLNAYLLVNGRGDTIDAAPIAVVINPKDRDNAGVIENGRSCFSCHGKGLISATDRMRSFMRAADDELFNDFVIDGTLALHVEKEAFDKELEKDNNLYKSAMTEAFVFPARIPQATFNIEVYDANMTMDRIASELNLTQAQFERFIPRLSIELRSTFQAAASGGLDRDVFERIYGDLLKEIFGLEQ